jgi:hypothetical protein
MSSGFSPAAGGAQGGDSAVTIPAQQGDYEGLQIQALDGTWVPVPLVEAALQVFSGTPLARWSGGRLRSEQIAAWRDGTPYVAELAEDSAGWRRPGRRAQAWRIVIRLGECDHESTGHYRTRELGIIMVVRESHPVTCGRVVNKRWITAGRCG